ncbi:hypothetical protein BD324DRAFT_647903 [Kockovaella imperatae]|uniref:Ribosomal protein S15 n=1 Tax=Kockovaella imperatae TaxID=4999 RepID=A0A1Y1USK8_9TREE|nr:hypothetical protein BD324DRAFT_647903 [Kockovaella imperatae]ORX41003.1 hypothetical protein BD324DRAFT_647903 [Kockovaella imperatae]
MSRLGASLTNLRAALPPLSQAGPSSRPFSSTPTILAPGSRKQGRRSYRKGPAAEKPIVLRKRIFHEEKNRTSKNKDIRDWYPDHVLGHVFSQPFGGPKKYHGKEPPLSGSLWDGCRLAKTLIHPRQVWSWPVPKYELGETPQQLIPGLSAQDKDILFGAVPYTSTAIQYDPGLPQEIRDAKATKVAEDQEKQEEMVYRILDLRNASRSQIQAFNRRRIIEEFGQGYNSGDSICQSALLTMEIRSLNEHCLVQIHDVQNRERLKRLVYERAKHLKYLKRKYPAKYDQALLDLGLDPRTVEGELILRT